MGTPYASFENPRFSGTHGTSYKQGPQVKLAILAADKSINATLSNPGEPMGHSQPNQKKIEPLRQQNILTVRADEDAVIIAHKYNQEIQQISASSTRSNF